MIDNITDWIKTLADNSYAQAEGTMCSIDADAGDPFLWENAKPHNGFCCLGVRRFLAQPEVPEEWYDDGAPYGFDSSEPEKWEREAFGLTEVGMQDLMGFNDAGMGFPEIAAQILMYPSYYFGEGLGAQVEEYFFGHTAEEGDKEDEELAWLPGPDGLGGVWGWYKRN